MSQINKHKTNKLCSPSTEAHRDSVIHANILACEDFKHKSFSPEKALERSEQGIESLKTKEGLQDMLAAQMLSIHNLQQQSMALAHVSQRAEASKYYTNAAIKLANVFVQQANTLAKLQGFVSQRITVEKVNVHEGGRAVVGNVSANAGKE
jgi:hypothetical protein